jgi:hypothetical protein
MSLEIHCPGCGRTLQIADEHAGKQIRCPACQQISVAPTATTTAKSLAAGPVATKSDPATWHLRTPEGQTYGPIPWWQVQTWAGEGRIGADCLLAESTSGPWRAATELLSDLPGPATPQPTAPSSPTTYPWTPASPFAPQLGGDGRAAAASTGPFAPAGSYVAPHRGGLILALGLLGFIATCPIFSLMAWVMGSHDLREMRAGRMDRSGEGLTQAGLVLGMILSLLEILGCVLVLFVILVAAVARN